MIYLYILQHSEVPGDDIIQELSEAAPLDPTGGGGGLTVLNALPTALLTPCTRWRGASVGSFLNHSAVPPYFSVRRPCIDR